MRCSKYGTDVRGRSQVLQQMWCTVLGKCLSYGADNRPNEILQFLRR